MLNAEIGESAAIKIQDSRSDASRTKIGTDKGIYMCNVDKIWGWGMGRIHTPLDIGYG